MSIEDDFYAQLELKVRTLSKRSQIAFLWAGGSVLLMSVAPDGSTRKLCEKIDVGFRFTRDCLLSWESVNDRSRAVAASISTEIMETERLEMFEADPAGIALDASNRAVDRCLGGISGEDVDLASGIECVTAPIVSSVTDRLYGFIQLGSSPEENSRMKVVLEEPEVAKMTDYCTWAVERLRTDSMTPELLDEIRSAASCLVPQWT
jgi:hypothetical protein